MNYPGLNAGEHQPLGVPQPVTLNGRHSGSEDLLADERSKWKVMGGSSTAAGKTVHVRVESMKQPGATDRVEAQDAESRAIALLGMRTIGEDRLDERGRLRPNRAGPVDEARGRPLEVLAVGFGHVGRVGRMRAADGAPAMGGDALAAMEDHDGGGGQARVDVFVRSDEPFHAQSSRSRGPCHRWIGPQRGRNLVIPWPSSPDWAISTAKRSFRRTFVRRPAAFLIILDDQRPHGAAPRYSPTSPRGNIPHVLAVATRTSIRKERSFL